MENIKEIRLWNRTLSRAQQLGQEFSKIVICDWNNLIPHNTQIIIVSTLPPTAQELCDWNAFSAPGSFGVVLDLVYHPKITPLISFFSQLDYKIVYGVKVLLYQGLEQFKLWTGRNAPRAELMAEIGAE
jgi:shikimate 5-dehydrogenase